MFLEHTGASRGLRRHAHLQIDPDRRFEAPEALICDCLV